MAQKRYFNNKDDSEINFTFDENQANINLIILREKEMQKDISDEEISKTKTITILRIKLASLANCLLKCNAFER